MLNVPPGLADAAAWAARAAARRGTGSSSSDSKAPFGIQLRRFAGPVAYQKTISHLRVAHLTDLHVGRITPVSVQRAAVQMANAENPEVIVTLIASGYTAFNRYPFNCLISEAVSAVAAFPAVITSVV